MSDVRKRVLSATAGGGGVIERAGAGRPLAMADWEIRERCRNAPQFIRRNIDARREARGLPPLWGTPAGSPTAHRQHSPGAASTVARWKAYLVLAGSAVAAGRR